MTDFGAVYASTRTSLIGHLRDLTPAEAATKVPACPGWSAKDVVAHVAGLVADVLAGMKPPFGSFEMTSRQVAERAEATLAEVCDEWAANGDAMAAFMAENPMTGMGFTADLTIHYDDLAEAVEAIPTAPDDAVAVACGRYVPLLQERLVERLDIALTVTLDDQVWEPTGGSTARTLTAGRSDYLRALTGRRTRAEVERMLTWDADASAILDDAFLQYGDYQS